MEKFLMTFQVQNFAIIAPTTADLNALSRIKTLGSVPPLIYNKVSAGIYKVLEPDTAATQGVLYTHLWNLIWDLAEVPTNEHLAEYRHLHRQANPPE